MRAAAKEEVLVTRAEVCSLRGGGDAPMAVDDADEDLVCTPIGVAGGYTGPQERREHLASLQAAIPDRSAADGLMRAAPSSRVGRRSVKKKFCNAHRSEDLTTTPGRKLEQQEEKGRAKNGMRSTGTWMTMTTTSRRMMPFPTRQMTRTVEVALRVARAPQPSRGLFHQHPVESAPRSP